jgi:hypothetical protein
VDVPFEGSWWWLLLDVWVLVVLVGLGSDGWCLSVLLKLV